MRVSRARCGSLQSLVLWTALGTAACVLPANAKDLAETDPATAVEREHGQGPESMGFEHIEKVVRAHPGFDAGWIEIARFDQNRRIAGVNGFLQAFLPPHSSDVLVTAGITNRGRYVVVERYDGTRWHDIGDEVLPRPAGPTNFNFNYFLDDQGALPVVREVAGGQAYRYDGTRFVAE